MNNNTSTTPTLTSTPGLNFEVLRSAKRGLADHGWLKSRHTFSFADYYNPDKMGFRSLRVINEDRIAGGTGFGTHPHRDMEIISYVVEGSLEHKDSMGNKAVITPGEVQRLTAGTGIAHSEINHEKIHETHFFQIWIMPNAKGMAPGYGQQNIEQRLIDKKFMLAVSNDGRDGSIEIAQDADLYIGRLSQKDSLEFKVNTGRYVWIQVVKGDVSINGTALNIGDALAISPTDSAQSGTLKIAADSNCEFMLFDLE